MTQAISIDSRGRRISTRRHRSLEEKIALVAQSQQPGASVAEVARLHGLNANVLFVWRRLHQRGLLESHTRRGKGRRLVPVKLLTPEGAVDTASPSPLEGYLPPDTRLRVRFACGAELSVQGRPDAQTLENLIRLLRC
jgi:transposase